MAIEGGIEVKTKGVTEFRLKVIHPTRDDQDTNCPQSQWMGEDLNHCPGVGEWKCMLQDYQWGDLLCGGGSENTDYRACNHPEHGKRSVYLEHQKPTKPSSKGQLEFQFT